MILFSRSDPLAPWLSTWPDAHALPDGADRLALERALVGLTPGGSVSLILRASQPINVLSQAVQTFTVWAETRSLPSRVLLVSSAEVYGSPRPGVSLREPDALATNPQGKALLEAEAFLAERAERRGFSLVVARPFEVLEPTGAGLLGALCRRVRSGDLSGLGDAGASRDFLDARDVAAALVALGEAKRGEPLLAVVNLCSGRAVTVRELVGAIAQRYRPEQAAQFATQLAVDVPSAEAVPLWRVGNPARFVELTGGPAVRTPLAQSIEDAWGAQPGGRPCDAP